MMRPKRVLSIWLPLLPVERWARNADYPPDKAVVLTIEGAHGPIIHAVTKAAAERGAQPGARLTDARALDPALVAIAADPQADAALVERLARWAGRWSPLVEVDGKDGLRLDVTGVAHLFGGECRLVSDIYSRFAILGVTPRVAIAPTAAAAWALSHHAPCICGSDDIPAKLMPLPVSALRLEEDTVRILERLGLKTIKALMDVPRLALARRFRGAENVVDAIDRVVGRKPEPLTAVIDDQPPRSTVRLNEPATHVEAASQALDRLIPLLVRELEQRRLGARRLSITGYRVDSSIGVVSVATAIPSREPKHLQRLLADKAAALDPQFGFDAFTLTADWTEDLGAAQESLVEEPSSTRELARLVDRLTVKLGPNAVRRPQIFESHVPERSMGWVAAIHMPFPKSEGYKGGPIPSRPRIAEEVSSATTRPFTRHPSSRPFDSEDCKRPQRLLDRPEAIDVIYATPEGMPRRFRWRRAMHDIARVEGPERVAPEWWRQPSSARLRDYYRVEDAQGRRYWIYREGLIGDGRGGVPAWFIHGLFG
ncbi:MAG TPA: DNA polymerase Y family protein [Sphingomicrobium sp.]|nr:DNA polymerase Y family protein [Sphingomicrobium sp.]